MSDYQILNRFTAENIQKATVGLLHYLGIATDLITEKQVAITDLVEQPTKAVLEICRKIHESYLVCSISDRTFSDEEQDETLDEVKENIGKYDQMLVFAVDLHKDTKLCRTEMATLTRALNRASKAAPVVIVFRYYDDGEVRFALSLCERTAYLQAGHTGEKVGRVNILRGINPQKTHAGHIRILEDMRLEKKDKSFEGVYQKWLGVFDNDVLTNKFYEELQNWYFWALKPECRVSFPNDVESDSDDDKYNPQNIIRLITRLIFVWFLRQKGLVLKELFKRDSLARLLKDFKPEDLNSSTYYRAVLQNLFFATLNKKIEEREFMSDEFIMNRNKGKHDVKTFMRHASDLQVSKEEFIELLHPVPFMNNSLFECLDNKEQNGHVYNWDGFSDSKKPQKQAFVPNYLFFAEDVYIDLSEEYGKAAASSIKVSGIINILSKYTFTVEENTPLDVDVALDPELLGKVFENLLAAYNPETKETVRKSTGSYYTPRPIVQYMVDESLIAYLKKQVDGVSEDTLRSLLSYTDDDVANPLDRKQTRRLVDAIFRCKVLDPACGSGAFPMGMLQQMAHLLSRVDSDNSIWEEVVIDNAIRYENTIDTMSDEEKAERQAEREKVFALSVDYPDYARKLYLIENCIYGVDLQSIAVQISRLRFFISLVCEQQPTDDATDNYGIHPLPNLEMKFVCANTLVKLENISETRELFANNEIINLIQDLKGVRHELFVVTNSHVKKRLLEKDKTIRDKIMLSTGDCYTRDTEEKIARHEAGLAECAKEMRIAERMSDEVITQAVTQDLFGEKEEVISYSPKQNKIKDINQRISYIKREIKRLQDSLNNGRDKAMRLAKQLTDWNPYDQNLSSPFFDADWMFGVTDGFDVVIGNPPYIQLQSNGGELAALYEEANYKSFARTGDIYCLFYEHGWEMLSEGGSLCFITSNKWMRAGYGEKLRAFLSENTNPELLIDFSGLKIFESATVDVNILLFSRQQNKGQTICAVTAKQPRCCIENLSLFVQQQHSTCEFNTSDSWVILSPIEQSIKRKIEAVGTPLKEWGIQIYRGVLTGYNEAFIISTEKRNEILSNCLTADERSRTEELIRPILRGRDIKRYGYDWAGLWLINTHNGIKGVKERIHIEDYPAIKVHLDQYWPKISKRADKGDTPYNLRNCAYMEDFSKPKIIYSEITQGSAFVLDENKILLTLQTGYILVGKHLEWLISNLNSTLIEWAFRSFYSIALGNRGLRWLKQYIEILPIVKPTPTQEKALTSLLKSGDYVAIDNFIYQLYNLTSEEISFIENRED